MDGFRVDAAPHLYERQDLLDAPFNSESPNELEVNGYIEFLNETYDEVKTWRALIDEHNHKNDGNNKLVITSNTETII